MKEVISKEIFGQTYSLETGRMAKQADGSCVIRSGDTMVLVTAVSAKKAKPDLDFLPLTVDYLEKFYAAGRIPGGYFKRETKPTDREVLTSRLIDRPLRPLFPEGYNFETQIVAQVISADPNCESDVLAITAASTALAVSDIPFTKLMAGVRVCRIDGQLVINPPASKTATADLEIIVAGTKDAIVMVEGGSKEVSESDMVDALEYAHQAIRSFVDFQEELARKVNKTKRVFEPAVLPENFFKEVSASAADAMVSIFNVREKLERYTKMDELKKTTLATLLEKIPEADKAAAQKNYERAFGDLKHHVMRNMVAKDKRRIDGRSFTDIRPITCETGVLPRAHGSALFTRGETQALVILTFGTKDDEQRIETLTGTVNKRFNLHYNFPGFSVGEAKPLRGPGRREVGHGRLAERAIEKVLPTKSEEFPFAVRIVSEILESNGSSSMASVCGASLALMDGGCRIPEHVAGIAMGLIKEGEQVAILSDILGDEDHLGDMDFKVCGTARGITSIQMDIKIDGVDRSIMSKALEQARLGRLHILEKMQAAIAKPKTEMSPYAPRTHVMMIAQERIKDLIGPGGKIIKSIVEETGSKIDIDDTGKVTIFALDAKTLEKTAEIVKRYTAEVEVGRVYDGKVMKIMDFGAFVEIMPGTEGLVHISQLDQGRVQRVEDVAKQGDRFPVIVLEIDRSGRLRLSRKDAVGKEVGSIHRIESQGDGARGPRRG